MADQTPNNPTNPPTSPGAAGGEPPPAPRKKARWGRRILIAAGVVVVLLVVLVLLIPTIASMGFVRSIVVGKINNNLNGKVAIDSWSLGWTGGIDVNGVSVVGPAGEKVVDVRKVRTDLSLLDAIRGRYDLGKVVVDGLRLNVVKYDDGTTNLQKLAKSQPSGPSQEQPAPSQPQAQQGEAQAKGQLPNVSADVVLTDCQATVSGAGIPQPVNAAFGGEVKVPGINQAMTDTINAALTIGGKAAGKVDLAGTADVFENNQFDDKTASASQKLNIQGLQLASVAALLPTTAVDALRGVTDGNLVVDLKNGSDGMLQGQVVTRDVSVSGPALNGDTFQSDAVGLTIPATSIVMPNGPGDSGAYHIRTGGGTLAPIVVSLGKTPKGEEIGGAQVLVDAQVAAIQNAFAGKAPGSAGKVEVSDNLDIAALARMMPRTLKVVEGVQVQSGKLTQQNTVALTPQRGTIHAVTDLSAVSAVDTKANKPITIRPIHLDASAAAGGGGATDFRDIALNLTSGFATASFKGQTLADLAGKAHGDLKAMHDEVGQVVDFGKLDLAGTFDMTLASSGNLAEENGRGKVQTQMTLQNLRVAGLADGKTVDQKWMNVTAGADLERGQTKFVNAINNAVVTIKSGDPNNPTIDVVTNANVNLAGETATVGFAIQKLFVDAARAQTEFAAFVPGDYRVTSGTVSASAVGTWSGGTLKLDNFTAQPANLTVNLQGKDGRSTPVVNGLTMNAEAAGTVATGQQQTIDLTKLNVVEQNKRLLVQKVSDGPLVLTSGPNGFSGNGKLHVGADLAFVNSIVQAVSAGGQQVVAQSKAGEVKSGALDGTLGFDSASGKPTNLAGDFKIADLVVTTAGGGATQPETVTLTLQATAPSDFATVTAPKVSVTSRFANLNVTDALLKLKDPSNPNAVVGTLDKLQKANVAVDVTDVGTLYSIAGAFMPAAAATTAPAAGQAAPLEPLVVSGGHAKANVVVARDNGVTTLNVSDVSGGEIQLRRGNRSYTVQPFTAELAAAVKDGGDQIAQIDVSKLAAKSGVADVTMEQPISIKNPGADQMAATGALRVAGQIRPASDLLAVVQGKPLPYNGAYVMVQKLNTEGSTIGLAGNVDLTNFQVLDDQGQVSFAEDKVAVTNDLKINQKAKNVAGSLNVDSKALGVKFNGGVNQFDTTRAIVDGTTLALNYDAAKVWQVVRPMLSPETRENLGDVQVTGVKQVTFKLGGSYPANEPFQQAIAKLNASGALPLDTLTLPTKGIDAKQINPGFTLAGGKLTLTTGPGAATVTAAATSKPGAGGGGPMVVTALLNGGSVDLSNAVVDLTTPEPRLSTPPNKALAHNVGMNPVLAGYANKAVPVFDTTTQTALVDVTVVRCDKLPLGSAMSTPNNGGYAEIVVSLTNVRPGGPIIGGINQFVGGFFGNSVQAAVEPTTIAISDGVAKVNNFALVVGAQQHETLKLDGTVSLADNGPLNLTANIPSDMIKRFGKDILKYLPQGVDLPIAGTKEHPEFASADKVVSSLAKQALTNAAAGALGGKGGKNGKGGGLGDILGNVLGGDEKNQQQAQPQQQQQQKGQQQQQQAQPQSESPEDAIGGLLNSLTQDRDSKKDKKKKK